MTRERWMALGFAVGSVCFVLAPIGVYARLVGSEADAATLIDGDTFKSPRLRRWEREIEVEVEEVAEAV